MAAPKPDKQRLPKKEAETFKNIVKFYETKRTRSAAFRPFLYCFVS